MKLTYLLTTLLTAATAMSMAIPAADADAEAKKVTIRVKKTKTKATTKTVEVTKTLTTVNVVTIVPTDTSLAESDDDFQDIMVEEHNAKRALHGVGNLTWSTTLQEAAEEFASQYDCSGILTHSKLPYGENIALGYSSVDAVDAWYDEISKYNYDDPKFSEATGHFTQVVWKDTTELGCARINCAGYYGQYTLCEYNPAGNYAGQFPKNVLPLV